MMDPSSVQVVIYHNDGGVDADGVMVVASKMAELLTSAPAKLGMAWSARRVFSLQGEEVMPGQIRELKAGMEFVVSSGEDFKARAPDWRTRTRSSRSRNGATQSPTAPPDPPPLVSVGRRRATNPSLDPPCSEKKTVGRTAAADFAVAAGKNLE